ncbi:DUF4837 family protein [Thalassobellus sediminis]|uniref:DUF4837 family protein n=1 Tax=Thalassobellus sediminis TaxID=3367753 RepID=UPI00379A0299
MRHLFIAVLSLLLVMSCGDKKSNKRILLDSSGKINDISVVLSNDMWDGSVGESIRDVLASPIYGLPQDEPVFNINQIPSHVFSGFITQNRTILKIEMGKDPAITFNNNVYAQPQKVITVSGKTKQEVIKLLNDNASKIIESFKNTEILAKQKQTRKSLYNAKEIQENLGLNIEFPTAYRIGNTLAKKEDKFYWLKRDIPTGYVNILLYELPLNIIKKDTSIVEQIIKIRDSIGKKYIAGPLEGSYMITENKYTPFHSEIILDNKTTLETKGIWEVENAVMAGPFINYAIEDKINNRWIIAEGFAYAPSVEKRNYIFELEAIIKSIKIEK